MAEPNLTIFGNNSYQDLDFFYISKTGLAAKIQQIAESRGKTANFTPLEENKVESLIGAIVICCEAEMTQEKRTQDPANVNVTVVSSGKSLDSLTDGNEQLIFSYRIELYQSVTFPGPNPDSY